MGQPLARTDRIQVLRTDADIRFPKCLLVRSKQRLVLCLCNVWTHFATDKHDLARIFPTTPPTPLKGSCIPKSSNACHDSSQNVHVQQGIALYYCYLTVKQDYNSSIISRHRFRLPPLGDSACPETPSQHAYRYHHPAPPLPPLAL